MVGKKVTKKCILFFDKRHLYIACYFSELYFEIAET